MPQAVHYNRELKLNSSMFSSRSESVTEQFTGEYWTLTSESTGPTELYIL